MASNFKILHGLYSYLMKIMNACFYTTLQNTVTIGTNEMNVGQFNLIKCVILYNILNYFICENRLQANK